MKRALMLVGTILIILAIAWVFLPSEYGGGFLQAGMPARYEGGLVVEYTRFVPSGTSMVDYFEYPKAAWVEITVHRGEEICPTTDNPRWTLYFHLDNYFSGTTEIGKLTDISQR